MLQRVRGKMLALIAGLAAGAGGMKYAETVMDGKGAPSTEAVQLLMRTRDAARFPLMRGCEDLDFMKAVLPSLRVLPTGDVGFFMEEGGATYFVATNTVALTNIENQFLNDEQGFTPVRPLSEGALFLYEYTGTGDAPNAPLADTDGKSPEPVVFLTPGTVAAAREFVEQQVASSPRGLHPALAVMENGHLYSPKDARIPPMNPGGDSAHHLPAVALRYPLSKESPAIVGMQTPAGFFPAAQICAEVRDAIRPLEGMRERRSVVEVPVLGGLLTAQISEEEWAITDDERAARRTSQARLPETEGDEE